MRRKVLLWNLLLWQVIFGYSQTLLPPDGKTLLVIGQDLQSVYDYAQSGYFPTPGGVTSYASLYDVANPSAAFPFGGLGEDLQGDVAPDIDWGAGPLNTHNAGYGYPNSTLAIGLYMTEEFFPGGLTGIANGGYDTEVNRLADFLADLDQPVFLRIGYEFDGNWNIGYNNTTNFINAYKHIVDIIRPKAPKTMMVWQSCTSPVDDIIEGYHEDITTWYPGDDYVDYMGYSWFITTQQQYELTDELVEFARERGKPVMVSESAPQGYDLNELNYRYINTMLGGAPGTNPVSKTPTEIWDEWFDPFFEYIHENSDVIRVVAYINADWDSQAKWAPPYNEGYWGDTRVQMNAEIRDKWNEEITSDFWIHGSEDLFDLLEGEDVITNPAPTVSFTIPTQGQTYDEGTNVVVAVNATDNTSITKVELYLNNVLVRTESLAPYGWGNPGQNDAALTAMSKGDYTLKAIAFDDEGKSTTKTLAFSVVGEDDENPPVVIGDDFAPEDGKTLVMIGQTYTQEFQDYVSATGKAPAGSSHYAELYSGTINQGDDGNNEAFLNHVESNYPCAYSELAISIKDNPAAGGYSGPNGVWQACIDITNGDWDDEIDAIAQSIKAREDIKFFVRIGYEVSLNMFANKTTTEFIEILNKYTGMGINPLEQAHTIEEFDLDAYKDAFNYIAHRIKVTNAVDNAAFVFHPVRGINDAKQLYPGDEYVDWYSISLFNHDVCWPTWEGATPPFENCPTTEALDDNVRQSLEWANNTIEKPIMIGEAAAQSHVTEQDDASHMIGYLDKIFNIIETYDVKGFVYINSDWSSHGWSDQWGDSRVQKDPAVLQHWNTEMAKSRYIHYQACEEENDDVDEDGITNDVDCDDNDPNVGRPSTWYADSDGDGLGDYASSQEACTQPEGYVATSGDECPLDQYKTSPGSCGCGKSEESCLDCAGTPNGDAYYDNCQNCVGGTTGLTACVQDCNDEWGGEAFLDDCEICAGGNTGVEPQEECVATNIELEQALGVKVYPNPFEATLTIEIDEAATVKIMAVTGQVVWQEKIESGKSISPQLAAGMYLIQLITNDNEQYTTLIQKQ